MRLLNRPRISGLLAVVYFATNVALAHSTESNMWSERRKATAPIQLASLPASLQTLNQIPTPKISLESVSQWKTKNARLNDFLAKISASDVRIQEVHDSGAASAPLLLIQDVHMNNEAQGHVAAVLQDLINQNQVGMVGVEGAFHPLDFETFRAYPDKTITRNLSQSYFEAKRLSAPSFVGVTSPIAPPPFVGIDDKTHYDANVQSYLSSREVKEKLSRDLDEVDRILAVAKAKTFSPDLKRFDDLRRAHHGSRIGFGKYLQQLKSFGKDSSLIIDQFLEAYGMETRLDFARVEAERKIVLSRLAEKLDERELSDLVVQSVAYRTGKMSFGAYYENLKKLCERIGVSLDRAPNFKNYIRYALLSDGLHADELFAAVEVWENQIVESLARTSDEKQLVQESEHLAFTRKLLDFSLTPKEWNSYQITKNQNLRANPLNLKPFEQFYVQADLRSDLMINNLVFGSWNLDLPKPKVLVVGGFHTPRITELLREKKISYVVVSPQLTKIGDETGSAYLSVFAREKTPLDKVFSGEKLFLSPPTHLDPALPVHEELKIDLFNAQGIPTARPRGALMIWLMNLLTPLMQRYLPKTDPVVRMVKVLPFIENSLALSIGTGITFWLHASGVRTNNFVGVAGFLSWCIFFLLHLVDFSIKKNRADARENFMTMSHVAGVGFMTALLPFSAWVVIPLQTFGMYMLHSITNSWMARNLQKLGALYSMELMGKARAAGLPFIVVSYARKISPVFKTPVHIRQLITVFFERFDEYVKAPVEDSEKATLSLARPLVQIDPQVALQLVPLTTFVTNYKRDGGSLPDFLPLVAEFLELGFYFEISLNSQPGAWPPALVLSAFRILSVMPSTQQGNLPTIYVERINGKKDNSPQVRGIPNRLKVIEGTPPKVLHPPLRMRVPNWKFLVFGWSLLETLGFQTIGLSWFHPEILGAGFSISQQSWIGLSIFAMAYAFSHILMSWPAKSNSSNRSRELDFAVRFVLFFVFTAPFLYLSIVPASIFSFLIHAGYNAMVVNEWSFFKYLPLASIGDRSESSILDGRPYLKKISIKALVTMFTEFKAGDGESVTTTLLTPWDGRIGVTVNEKIEAFLFQNLGLAFMEIFKNAQSAVYRAKYEGKPLTAEILQKIYEEINVWVGADLDGSVLIAVENPGEIDPSKFDLKTFVQLKKYLEHLHYCFVGKEKGVRAPHPELADLQLSARALQIKGVFVKNYPETIQIIQEKIDILKAGKKLTSKDAQELIFTWFFSSKLDDFLKIYFGKDASFMGGTGVGLKIAQSTLAQADIPILLESTQRHTRFIIRVPKHLMQIMDLPGFDKPASILYESRNPILNWLGHPLKRAPFWEAVFQLPLILGLIFQWDGLALSMTILASSIMFSDLHKGRSPPEKRTLIGVGFLFNAASLLPLLFLNPSQSPYFFFTTSLLSSALVHTGYNALVLLNLIDGPVASMAERPSSRFRTLTRKELMDLMEYNSPVDFTVLARELLKKWDGSMEYGVQGPLLKALWGGITKSFGEILKNAATEVVRRNPTDPQDIQVSIGADTDGSLLIDIENAGEIDLTPFNLSNLTELKKYIEHLQYCLSSDYGKTAPPHADLASLTVHMDDYIRPIFLQHSAKTVTVLQEKIEKLQSGGKIEFEDAKELIFSYFFTTKVDYFRQFYLEGQGNTDGGAGLGIKWSDFMLKPFGGEIRLESKKGVTRFTIYVPAKAIRLALPLSPSENPTFRYLQGIIRPLDSRTFLVPVDFQDAFFHVFGHPSPEAPNLELTPEKFERLLSFLRDRAKKQPKGKAEIIYQQLLPNDEHAREVRKELGAFLKMAGVAALISDETLLAKPESSVFILINTAWHHVTSVSRLLMETTLSGMLLASEQITVFSQISRPILRDMHLPPDIYLLLPFAFPVMFTDEQMIDIQKRLRVLQAYQPVQGKSGLLTAADAAVIAPFQPQTKEYLLHESRRTHPLMRVVFESLLDQMAPIVLAAWRISHHRFLEIYEGQLKEEGRYEAFVNAFNRADVRVKKAHTLWRAALNGKFDSSLIHPATRQRGESLGYTEREIREDYAPVYEALDILRPIEFWRAHNDPKRHLNDLAQNLRKKGILKIWAAMISFSAFPGLFAVVFIHLFIQPASFSPWWYLSGPVFFSGVSIVWGYLMRLAGVRQLLHDRREPFAVFFYPWFIPFFPAFLGSYWAHRRYNIKNPGAALTHNTYANMPMTPEIVKQLIQSNERLREAGATNSLTLDLFIVGQQLREYYSHDEPIRDAFHQLVTSGFLKITGRKGSLVFYGFPSIYDLVVASQFALKIGVRKKSFQARANALSAAVLEIFGSTSLWAHQTLGEDEKKIFIEGAVKNLLQAKAGSFDVWKEMGFVPENVDFMTSLHGHNDELEIVAKNISFLMRQLEQRVASRVGDSNKDIHKILMDLNPVSRLTRFLAVYEKLERTTKPKDEEEKRALQERLIKAAFILSRADSLTKSVLRVVTSFNEVIPNIGQESTAIKKQYLTAIYGPPTIGEPGVQAVQDILRSFQEAGVQYPKLSEEMKQQYLIAVYEPALYGAAGAQAVQDIIRHLKEAGIAYENLSDDLKKNYLVAVYTSAMEGASGSKALEVIFGELKKFSFEDRLLWLPLVWRLIRLKKSFADVQHNFIVPFAELKSDESKKVWINEQFRILNGNVFQRLRQSKKYELVLGSTRMRGRELGLSDKVIRELYAPLVESLDLLHPVEFWRAHQGLNDGGQGKRVWGILLVWAMMIISGAFPGLLAETLWNVVMRDQIPLWLFWAPPLASSGLSILWGYILLLMGQNQRLLNSPELKEIVFSRLFLPFFPAFAGGYVAHRWYNIRNPGAALVLPAQLLMEIHKDKVMQNALLRGQLTLQTLRDHLPTTMDKSGLEEMLRLLVKNRALKVMRVAGVVAYYGLGEKNGAQLKDSMAAPKTISIKRVEFRLGQKVKSSAYEDPGEVVSVSPTEIVIHFGHKDNPSVMKLTPEGAQKAVEGNRLIPLEETKAVVPVSSNGSNAEAAAKFRFNHKLVDGVKKVLSDDDWAALLQDPVMLNRICSSVNIISTIQVNKLKELLGFLGAKKYAELVGNQPGVSLGLKRALANFEAASKAVGLITVGTVAKKMRRDAELMTWYQEWEGILVNGDSSAEVGEYTKKMVNELYFMELVGLSREDAAKVRPEGLLNDNPLKLRQRVTFLNSNMGGAVRIHAVLNKANMSVDQKKQFWSWLINKSLAYLDADWFNRFVKEGALGLRASNTEPTKDSWLRPLRMLSQALFGAIPLLLVVLQVSAAVPLEPKPLSPRMVAVETILANVKTEKFFGDDLKRVGPLETLSARDNKREAANYVSWISDESQGRDLVRTLLRPDSRDRVVLGVSDQNEALIQAMSNNPALSVSRLMAEGRLAFVRGNASTTVLDLIDQAKATPVFGGQNNVQLSVLLMEQAALPDQFFQLSPSQWRLVREAALVYFISQTLQAVQVDVSLLPDWTVVRAALIQA